MLGIFGRHVRRQFVGYLALFVALGGVSYAAVTLPRNSVGTTQIKPGAVKNSDLAKNAVTTEKVKDGSLLSTDFKPGQLVAGAPGPAGPGGPKGGTGAKGDPGTNGTNGTNGANGATNVAVVRTSLAIPAGLTYADSADCPAGQRATGGGVGANSGGSSADRIVQSGPISSTGLFSTTTTGTVPVGWYGRYYNGSGVTQAVHVWAICSAP